MTNTNYAIDSGDGNTLTAGLQGYDIARKVAKRLANRRGEAVYLYQLSKGEGDASEAVRPDSEPEIEATTEKVNHPAVKAILGVRAGSTLRQLEAGWVEAPEGYSDEDITAENLIHDGSIRVHEGTRVRTALDRVRPGDVAVDAMEALIMADDNVSRLTGSGLSARETAALWVGAIGDGAAGIAEPYIKAGCWDEDSVVSLIDAGIGADDLATAAEELGRNAAYDHSNFDLTTREILDALGRP